MIKQYPITDIEVETLKADGVVVLPGILTKAEIEGLRASVSQQMSRLGHTRSGYDFEDIGRQVWSKTDVIDTKNASRFDFERVRQRVLSDPNARPLLEQERSDRPKGCFFYDAAGWRELEGIRNVALDSQLPAAMATLMESSRVHFWEDTTFVKEPGTRQKTAFHQDLGYFQIDGEQCVIVWIPLDPADLDNGTMQYVRGSHKSTVVYAPNVLFAHSPTTGALQVSAPDIEADPDAYDIVSFDVSPGDVIVHHVRTLHGSGGNMSTRRRRAMSFRYCGDDVRYLNRAGAIEQLDIGHCLGDGDKLDSLDYPLVYPRPWPGLCLSEVFADFTASAKSNSQRKGSLQ